MERKSRKKNKENERGKKYRIGMQHNNTKGVGGGWGRGEEVGINTRSVALRGRVGGCPRNGARLGGGRHCAKLKEQNKKCTNTKYPNIVVPFNFLCCASQLWMHVQNGSYSLSAVIITSALYPSSDP